MEIHENIHSISVFWQTEYLKQWALLICYGLSGLNYKTKSYNTCHTPNIERERETLVCFPKFQKHILSF